MSSNNIPQIDSILLNIYKRGKYYNPAWSHYNESAIVSCDRCNRSQLKICIGWDKYDMCLKCVEEMSTLIPGDDPAPQQDCRELDKREIRTRMMQDMFRTSGDRYVTKMRQDMYRTSDSRYVTKMEQDIFRDT